jgi:hypothetical protein
MEPNTPEPSLPSNDVPALSPLEAERANLTAAVQSGAGWFFWVVGLSLVNSLMSLANLKFGFAIGLGITQVFDVLLTKAGTNGKVLLFVLSAVALGFYSLMGVLAPRFRWAFLIGGFFYLLDGLILLSVQEWLGLAFHAYVLYVFGRGFVAAGRLKQLPPPQSFETPFAPAPDAE